MMTKYNFFQMFDEIKAKVKNGTITEIETTRVQKHTKVNPLSFQNARDDFKVDKSFGNMIVQFEDGHPQTSKITRRKKLRK